MSVLVNGKLFIVPEAGMLGFIVKKLKQIPILTSKMIPDLRESVAADFPGISSEDAVGRLAVKIQQLMEKRICQFAPEDRRRIKTQLLREAVINNDFEITAADLFQAGLGLGRDDDRDFQARMAEWINQFHFVTFHENDIRCCLVEYRKQESSGNPDGGAFVASPRGTGINGLKDGSLSRSENQPQSLLEKRENLARNFHSDIHALAALRAEKEMEISRRGAETQRRERIRPITNSQQLKATFAFRLMPSAYSHPNLSEKFLNNVRRIFNVSSVAVAGLLLFWLLSDWNLNFGRNRDQRGVKIDTAGILASDFPTTVSPSNATRISSKLPLQAGRKSKAPQTGTFQKKISVKATAYDLSVTSCGKTPDHPEYGITFSGTKARIGRTIAVDTGVIPLGSKVYLDFPAKYKDLNGWYIAEDTGAKIKGERIDIFFGEDRDGSTEVFKRAKHFGVQKVEVYVMNAENRIAMEDI
jgi:3D (Asp-Asp-Asp) domain-containing protein